MYRNRIGTAAAVLLAAVSAAALFMVYMAVHGFYPFGGKSVAWCDMNQQYVPLLMELKTVFSDGSLLLGRGGGMMNFYGVFLFFVSSPVSLISLAADNSGMIYFVNIILVIKTGLCAGAAELYFRKVLPDLSVCFGVPMALMYSLSGYVMMYYQNDMWLDMMIWFPLLLISLFRLLERGRWGAYALCTAVCLFLNFYISFMVVLFLVLTGGAALYLCCDEKNRGDRALKLIAADLCAALLSGIVWLPAFAQYTSSGRGNSLGSIYFGGYFFEKTLDKTALLSGSSLVFAAAVLIIVYRNRFVQGKGAFFAYTGIVALAGAFIEPVSKLIQTGSYQAYPLRYGFIIILLLFSACGVLLAGRPSAGNGKTIYPWGFIALIAFAAASAAAYIHRTGLSSYAHSLWVGTKDGLVLTALGTAGAAVYYICISGYVRGRTGKAPAVIVMTAALICESFLGFGVNISNIEDPAAGFERTAEAFSRIPDEGFVRVKQERRYYYSNYAEGFGAYSIGHYSSLTDKDFLYAMKRMGYSSYWMDSSSMGGTMLTDSLLLNRYIIGTPFGTNRIYSLYDGSGGLPVYTYPNVLSGALISDVPPSELSGLDSTERMDATEFMAEKLFGAENIAEEIVPDTVSGLSMERNKGRVSVTVSREAPSELRYSVEVNGRKELYFDLFGNYSTEVEEEYYSSAEVFVNGRLVLDRYPSSGFCGIADLGTFENENVSVTVHILKDFEASSFGLYLFDAELWERASASAVTAPVRVSGRKVSLSADMGGWAYIPVAWSEGWNCTVNGQKAPVVRTLGSLCAVELPQGGGSTELSFLPEGFMAGAVLSAAGALVFAVLLFVLRKEQRRKNAGRLSLRTVSGLSAAAFAVFYIAAPLVWSAVSIIYLIIGG